MEYGGGMDVVYDYTDKKPGSGASEVTTVKQSGDMHFLGDTNEPGGYFPGDKVTVSVSKYVTHGLNAYGYPQSIPQPIIDNKTITLGETGGIVSLDLSKSAYYPLTDTPHKSRLVPPAAPGHANIQSRFGPGSGARERIDYQMGWQLRRALLLFPGS